MVAALGSGKPPLHRHLISDAPRLPLRSLSSFGKSVDLRWENPAGALLTTVSRSAAGILIETGGTSVRVELRSWPMPRGRGGLHGVRLRMVCPKCGALRDVLHWRGEWGCRGKGCLDLEHDCRHQGRWCPAIRRRARLLRALVRCSPRSLRAGLLREQIKRQERAMLANLKRVNRDLVRRKQGRRYVRRGPTNLSE